MEFLGKSFRIRFLWKSVSLKKIPWVSFRLEKNQWKPIELIWSQSKWTSLKEIFGNSFLRSRIDENCLHQWWKKNQIHFIEGIARWNDFIQVHCVETGFFESKFRKVDMIDGKTMETNFVYREARPFNFIHKNLSKSLSTIEKQGKSLSTVRNPIAQFSLEKRSWKHFVDMFSLKKILLKKFVRKLYEHP